MRTIQEVTEDEMEPESGGFEFRELIRALYKHKAKLITLTLLGLIGAVAIYILHTPMYESKSKIFVRYVEEVSNVDPIANDGRRAPAMESVINAEVEILQSWDLASAVVDEITPAAILGSGRDTSRMEAARQFLKGLDVDVAKGGRVITVTYRHTSPDVVVRALSTLVRLYQEKHVDIHRATKSRETSRSRRAALTAKVAELTDKIEQLKADSGVSSLNDAATGLNKRADEMRSLISAAETDFEEQKAQVAELKRMGLVTEATATPKTEGAAGGTAAADQRIHIKYQSLLKRLSRAQDEESALSLTYSSDSSTVKDARKRAESLEAERMKMETDNPKLLQSAQSQGGSTSPSTVDPVMETVRLATLKTRVDFLHKREQALKEEINQFASVSRRLRELERERDLQSEGLRAFAASFQRTEFETPLTADQYDNIVVVQGSSPPVPAISTLTKIICGVAMGGFVIGVGLIAILELGMNRGFRRPLDLESRGGIPLMLNIPKESKRRRRLARASAIRKRDGEMNGSTMEIEAWAGAHFIRPYAEAIRDRLVLHFEQIGLTRKPKLVGVAGYSNGVGASTIASGIAAALSEVGDGKVLLVDVNTAHASVHPFFEGKPAASLMEALEAGAKIGSVSDNLYLAKAPVLQGGKGMFPKRFYDMIPNLQASEFDYIIFDMPPMDSSSLTLAMSGFLDKILLVVEAEKDNRELVRRAGSELRDARAKLSGILNKTRSYGPKWLQEA